MSTIEITSEERDLLMELLDNTVSDLRAEIAHSDSPFYKDDLRKRKELFIDISKRVHEAPQTVE
jgi:hypothetical protein